MRPRYSATLFVSVPIASLRSASAARVCRVEDDGAVAGRARVATRSAIRLDDDCRQRHRPDSAVRIRMRPAVVAAHHRVGRGRTHRGEFAARQLDVATLAASLPQQRGAASRPGRGRARRARAGRRAAAAAIAARCRRALGRGRVDLAEGGIASRGELGELGVGACPSGRRRRPDRCRPARRAP